MAYNQYAAEQPGLIPSSPAPISTYEVKPNEPSYAPSQYTYSQQGGYQYTQGNESTLAPTRSERRVCGLRATTFWLVLALITVIIAAAVGGGVGGTLAVNNAKTQCLTSASAVLASISSATASTTAPPSSSSSSSTSSPSSSSFSSVPTGTTAWGPLITTPPYTGCPGNNNTVYTTTLSTSKFQIVCGFDIPYTATSDLLNAVTPTFELCMELCASWNDIGHGNGNASVSCKGVAFIPSHVNGDGSGNPIGCVLKSYADNLTVNPSYVVDSAILL